MSLPLWPTYREITSVESRCAERAETFTNKQENLRE